MIQELKISFDEESYKAIIGLTNAITKIAEMAEDVPKPVEEIAYVAPVSEAPLDPILDAEQTVDSSEDKTYTLIEARKLIGEYLKGGEQCRVNLENVLKEFGADMLPDVPQEKLGALLKRLGVV